MKIPEYQIRNVLMAYSRQLSERITKNKDSLNPVSNRPTITNSGKQKAILRKVMSDIFDKVSFHTDDEANLYKQNSLIEWKSEIAAMRKNGIFKQNTFTYIRFDEHNRKDIGVLSVGDNHNRSDAV